MSTTGAGEATSKIALLISGTDGESAIRGESVERIMSSQGYMVRTLDECKQVVEGLRASLMGSSSAVVFDLSGYRGQELALGCEEAGVAALYVFKPATGMFRKVRSAREVFG